jgi:hypothetical protein
MHMTTLLMQIPIYQAGPRLFCKMPDITSPYVQESFASSRDFKAASSENIPHRNSYYIYLFIASSSTNTYRKYSTPSVLKYLLLLTFSTTLTIRLIQKNCASTIYNCFLYVSLLYVF